MEPPELEDIVVDVEELRDERRGRGGGAIVSEKSWTYFEGLLVGYSAKGCAVHLQDGVSWPESSAFGHRTLLHPRDVDAHPWKQFADFPSDRQAASTAGPRLVPAKTFRPWRDKLLERISRSDPRHSPHKVIKLIRKKFCL